MDVHFHHSLTRKKARRNEAAGIIEHLIPCRLCKHYQYELCMEGHKPTDDEFFCKDSKRDPKRELKRESKGIKRELKREPKRGYMGMNIEDLEEVFEILPLAVIVSVFILTIVILEK